MCMFRSWMTTSVMEQRCCFKNFDPISLGSDQNHQAFLLQTLLTVTLRTLSPGFRMTSEYLMLRALLFALADFLPCLGLILGFVGREVGRYAD